MIVNTYRTLGFTLPEVMLCILILSISLPAAANLLAHSAHLDQRMAQLYQEDVNLQIWLAERQTAASGYAQGQLADGRQWWVENQGGVHFWRVAASTYSPEEFGWYLAK